MCHVEVLWKALGILVWVILGPGKVCLPKVVMVKYLLSRLSQGVYLLCVY